MPKRRRRSFTPKFKAQVVLEVLSGLKSQAEVTRQHKLKPELIARWKDIALEGLETLFRGGPTDATHGFIRRRGGNLAAAGESAVAGWLALRESRFNKARMTF